jgi:hypothetical protein
MTSYLFTLEEFGREALFLLDTVEEVSSIQTIRIIADHQDRRYRPYLDMGTYQICLILWEER